MDKNIEKQERYVLLKTKLKKAIRNEFWFEACMIEYAIIEDRTSSILHYARVCKDAYGSNKKLANKLSSIEHQIGKEHPIISKKVNSNTVEKIKNWKDKRNDLVHRSCILYNEKNAKAVAEEGILLVKQISNESAKVTKLAKRLENK